MIKEKENKMTFDEAFKELLDGKPITNTTFYGKGSRLIYEDGKIVERSYKDNVVKIFDLDGLINYKKLFPTDWKLYSPSLKFNDLKAGQKFSWVEGVAGIIYLRILEGNKYVNLSTGHVYVNYTDKGEVLLIDYHY